jgi:hypothetical protein
MGNQFTFNCDILKLYKFLTSSLHISLLKWQENITNHRFNGFNKFTLSVPICSTRYSFEIAVIPGSGQQ